MYTVLNKKELQRYPEFDNHFMVVKLFEPKVCLDGYISIHRQRQGYPALGATRLWSYSSEEDALRDSLRLARLMSYKSVLAGLPYTGAKAALIFSPNSQINRRDFFKAYASVVNELGGQFVTGTDVGVNNTDLAVMAAESKFMIGNGVDSGFYTAVGILDSILESLREVFNSEDLSARSFAIQGLGKTGGHLLKLLVKGGANNIFVTDINPRKTWYYKLRYPFIKLVNPVAIYTREADVFCPCALSHAVTAERIPFFKFKIIAGSANNQLESVQAGQDLFDKGILYAPDYVINAGGLVSVIDEMENGKSDHERTLSKIKKIRDSLSAIYFSSKQEGQSTNIVADNLAEEILERNCAVK